MRTLRATGVLIGLIVMLSLIAGQVSAEGPAKETVGIIGDMDAIADPAATVAGVTPTPSPEGAATATPLPLETSTPDPDAEATAVPTATSQDFQSAGYGNAATQEPKFKRKEQAATCKRADRPPTSHMLGMPKIVTDPEPPNRVWLLVAVAVMAAAFALGAMALRQRGEGKAPRGVLETVGAGVAICGTLAALAAQAGVPGASIQRPPPREVAMTVREVKPRITRGEYVEKITTGKGDAAVLKQIDKYDREEVGNVAWLEIRVVGFKDRNVYLQYGLYDLMARETLLPDTAKEIDLGVIEHDVVTMFYPAWVGYPRTAKFMAEFRLIDDHGGMLQMAATGKMGGTPFRYACENV